MADVQVFIDDAVRGALPEVCAKDGVPTTDQLRFTNDLGRRSATGLGVAWLLVLAGPLGWLALIVIAIVRDDRQESLTVQLPLSEPAYVRITRLRRERAIAGGVALASALVGLVALLKYNGTGGESLGWRVVALACATALVVGVVKLAITDHRTTQATVGLDLDASRRWVTLRRVHPTFAAACRAQEQTRDRQRT